MISCFGEMHWIGVGVEFRERLGVVLREKDRELSYIFLYESVEVFEVDGEGVKCVLEL